MPPETGAFSFGFGFLPCLTKAFGATEQRLELRRQRENKGRKELFVDFSLRPFFSRCAFAVNIFLPVRSSARLIERPP
jgi:hypothetical protein